MFVFVADTSASSSSKERGGIYPHSASAAAIAKPSATGMMMKFGNKFFEVCGTQCYSLCVLLPVGC